MARKKVQASARTGPEKPNISDPEQLRAVSRSVATTALRLSDDQFDRLTKAGVLRKPPRHGVHDLLGLMEDRLKLAEDENGGDGGDVSQTEAKRRFWAARALTEELEAAKLAGELVRLDAVLALDRQVFATLAVRLDGIAPRLATELAGISDAAVIRRLILAEIRAARTAAADALAKRDSTPDDPGDDRSDVDGAAGDVDDGMGGPETGDAGGERGAGSVSLEPDALPDSDHGRGRRARDSRSRRDPRDADGED